MRAKLRAREPEEGGTRQYLNLSSPVNVDKCTSAQEARGSPTKSESSCTRSLSSAGRAPPSCSARPRSEQRTSETPSSNARRRREQRASARSRGGPAERSYCSSYYSSRKSRRTAERIPRCKLCTWDRDTRARSAGRSISRSGRPGGRGDVALPRQWTRLLIPPTQVRSMCSQDTMPQRVRQVPLR